MRIFIIIWLGQTVSIIGSGMTAFAFTIWVWELTHQVTAIALFGLFAQLPQVLIAPIAGFIVDRWNRKYLMIVGDTVSGVVAIAILLLYSTTHLQLWHLYLAVAIQGIFEVVQELAYSTSISTMMPKQHYSRVSSLRFLSDYGSSIIAPTLAGILYSVIGLVGILIIDIVSFVFAVTTVLGVHIPQPSRTTVNTQSFTNWKQEIYFGWHYIAVRPSLLAMLVLAFVFTFAYDFGLSIYSPMVLALTGNDAKVLGTLASAAGIGGIVGVLLINSWGGFKRRIDGVLLGMIGVGLGKIIFGLAKTPLIWIPAQFCSSLNFPILGSFCDAIWLTKVNPQIQGRVFATLKVVTLIASTVAYLIAGPLADYIFEPAMMPDGSLAPILGWIFGTGKGSGMAVLYFISSLGMLLIGLSGYAFRTLRDVETILPDHDANTALRK
ncbi:MFS transporter [Nostoc sp. FACHB-133]|uniref:MFS transporter n=1 Tax=Nostoc sp. FACHB-133 TaxID=2692835 RepID=UPI001687B880|nr:MFS transporter [Nostoc sp. FACHB-133]MBD2523664.1 MFS transporter [Nostoc sp. FACHB-133]